MASNARLAGPDRIGRLALAALLLTLMAGASVRQASPPSPTAGLARLRALFPAQAPRLLRGAPPARFGAGYRLGADRVRAILPERSDAPVRIELASGRALEVIEDGPAGDALAAPGAIAYSRSGRTSIWRETPGGAIEEWILADSASVLPAWRIRGATLRQLGNAVLVLDASGEALLAVGTPEAFAAGGERLAVRLRADGDRLLLAVPPVQGPVLVDPVWAPAGEMSSKRWSFTLTRLANGEALAVGGYAMDASGTQQIALASAELFDPASNTWRPAGSMNGARAFHTATPLADGRVLVAGGVDGSNAVLASVEIYDPLTDSWSGGGAMVGPRAVHTATLLQSGRVLLTGGWATYPDCSYQATTEEYDPATRTTSPGGDMADRRNSHTATLLPDGRVLVAGGGSCCGCTLETSEIYDPTTRAFGPRIPMGAPFTLHEAAALSSGKVLIAGGSPSGPVAAAAALFDPATGTWTATGSLAARRYLHALVALHDGSALAIGGSDGAGDLASVERFDPATASWAPFPDLQAPRSGHRAVKLAYGDVLVAGSSTQAGAERLDLGMAGPGAACADGTGCASGICVDHVCCDAPCRETCHACSVAKGAPSDGTCAPISGGACDDGIACTRDETCQQGACVAGTNDCQCSRDQDCAAPADRCRSASCDLASGRCVYASAPDGSACDDGQACTYGDRCSGGLCAGTAYGCTAPECRSGLSCDGSGGCTGSPLPDGTACGRKCYRDACSAGTCAPGEAIACAPSGAACATAACDPGTGQCQPAAQPDGTPCRTLVGLPGRCAAGACAIAGGDGGTGGGESIDETDDGGGGCSGCLGGGCSPACSGEGSSCSSNADCCGGAICVNQRECVRGIFDSSCECSGPTNNVCADLSSVGVTECGVESASFNSCCPGTVWVNGRCVAEASCR